MKWIDSTKIVQWADKRECEGVLPELLRKLIIGSSRKFPELSFPSNDSIYKPGWDGKCLSDDEYSYVPKGHSFWEFGRDKDYSRKCNKDYAKRTKQTNLSIRKRSTFVFVTPRRWSKTPHKDDWAESRIKKGEWGNIKVYDADDLESWLEQISGVGSWFAQELKLATENVESAQSYWGRFVGKHNINPSLIISGREKEKAEILSFLSGSFGVKEVQASSRAEAICLTIASVISQGAIAEQSFFSKTLIVTRLNTLKTIVRIHEGLNIIYDSEGDELLYDYDAGTNHVVCPISFKVKSTGITVPIPKSEFFVKSLEGIGFTFEEARRLNKESGRSFSVLKRILSNSPGRVSWHEGNDILELLPIFFVQKFDDGKKGDREIIEELSGEDYEEYIEKLRRWSLIFDHPVMQISNHWRVVSSYDLLHVMARSILEHHLIQFESLFLRVYATTNPALDLEPKMRFAAAIFNKESQYSNRIQDGMCQTLVLFAVVGDLAGIKVNFRLQHWVDGIVEKLLSNHSIDFWLSIENKIHLLAEASPRSFLAALEGLIKKDPLVIGTMFSDKDFDLFTPTYHTHILWALEALAWEPSNLLRVTLILSDLDRLDKGIKTANRPINSLRHIFLLWLPQTYADFKSRKLVIDALAKRKKDVAFKLLREISPKPHDTGWFNYKPTLRLRDYETQKVTNKEWAEGISFVCEKMIEIAQNNCDQWAEIIDLIDDFSGGDRKRLIDQLTSIDDLNGNLDILRDKMQAFISRHESYEEQDWALKESELEPLKVFYSRLVSSEVDRYYWYFNVDTIDSYGKYKGSYEELLRKSNEKRKEAIITIIKAHGFDGITELSKRVEKPWLVGYLLSEASQEYESYVIELLSNESDKIESMAMGYLNRVSAIKGFDWVEIRLKSLSPQTSIEFITNFFLALEPSSKVWKLLEQTSAEATTIYWNRASFHHGHFRGSSEDLVKCIELLNAHERFSASANIMSFRKDELPPTLIIKTLEGLALTPNEDKSGQLTLSSYAIQQLFLELDKHDGLEDKVMLLEWYYLQLLNDGPHARPPKYLNKALREQPKFFAEVLSWIYQRDNKPFDEEITSQNRKFIANRAKNADELLDTWDRLPGEGEDGSVSLEVLKTWIDAVIKECVMIGRESKGYYMVGKLIGCAHERSNKWPQPEFCDIIEIYDHVKINDGFISGVINGSRIKASFRPFGGKPERENAMHYRSLAEGLGGQYPITEKLLIEVSNYYDRWAKRMDDDDAKRDLED